MACCLQRVEISTSVLGSVADVSNVVFVSDDADRLVWEFDEQFDIPLAGEQPNLADPVFQSRVLEMLSTQVRISQWLRLVNTYCLTSAKKCPKAACNRGNF